MNMIGSPVEKLLSPSEEEKVVKLQTANDKEKKIKTEVVRLYTSYIFEKRTFFKIFETSVS